MNALVMDLMFQGPTGYREFSDDQVAALQQDWERTRDPQRALSLGWETPVRAALAGDLPEYREIFVDAGITAVNLQVHAMTCADAMRWGALRQRQFDTHPWLHKATTADTIRKAHEAGEQAGFLNYQFVPVDMADLDFLDSSYDLGVRMAGLTYNTLTRIGAGCTERTDAGLSTWGVAVVGRMNELGIIVDTAHAGRRTTLDACDVSTAPVIASHTAAQAVYDHPRGKSDEELRALAETGGVIGIVTLPHFLSAATDADITTMVRHVAHVAEVVGPEHVAIGTDWPLALPKWTLAGPFKPFASDMGFKQGQLPDPDRNLVGFDSYADFPNITQGLVDAGFDDAEILGILGGNALRVFEAVCG